MQKKASNHSPPTRPQNDQKPRFATVKTGWIEYAKQETKDGPRRYARRRRWYWDKVAGKYAKTNPIRVREIPPMSEEDYEQIVARREAARRLKERMK